MHLARRFFLAATAVAAVAFAGTASAQPIVIKFSFVNPADSPKGKAAEYWKKLVEEGAKGRVKIELYPNSSLYKDKEELEALQLGSVQMLAPTLGKFSAMGLKDYEAFDLPYLFDNFEQVHQVTQGPTGKQLLDQLEPKGLKGLAFWDNGFKQMNANKALRVPADFKGVKMRIFSSKVLDAQMRALGAIPQVLAASEMYQAMQTGLVDGNENTESTFYDFKLYEVQKYLTESSHGYVGYLVVANKKFWDGLPADVRKVMEDAMAKTTVYANAISKSANEAALEGIKKTGKTTVIDLDAGAARRVEEGPAQDPRADGRSHQPAAAAGDLQGNRRRQALSADNWSAEMRPLEGLLVLDLTHMLSGPYGTMTLADLGARTIKVEPPGKGEGTRALLAGHPDYSRDGMGAYFMTLNRSKESVCIDLKSESGREVFYDLVRHADVVFDNFGAGVPQRLKIDHATLAAVNPRIITCSVTGFGETGPDTQRPAFDQVVQGMGGGMSITGRPDDAPVRGGIPIGDLGGGIFGAMGVLAALQARHVDRRRPARRRVDARRADLAADLHGDDASDVGPRAGANRQLALRACAVQHVPDEGRPHRHCLHRRLVLRALSRRRAASRAAQARIPEAADALCGTREDRRDHQRRARQEHVGVLA